MLSPSSRQDSQSCSGLCCKNTVAGGDDQVIRLPNDFKRTSSSILVSMLAQGWGQ